MPVGMMALDSVVRQHCSDSAPNLTHPKQATQFDEAQVNRYVLDITYAKDQDIKVNAHSLPEIMHRLICKRLGHQVAAALSLARLSSVRANRMTLANHGGLILAVCALVATDTDTHEVPCI